MFIIDSHSYTKDDLLSSADLFLSSNHHISSNPPRPYLIQPENPLDGIIQLLVSQKLNIDFLLDPLKLHIDDNKKIHASLKRPSQKKALREPQGKALPSTSAFSCLNNSGAFVTSGSTGQSKIVEKNFKHLYSEACQLQDLYTKRLDGTRIEKINILCLVQPFHIYGYLNAIVLPQAIQKTHSNKQISVILANPLQFSQVEKQLLSARSCFNIAITCPSIWSISRQLIEENLVDTFVCSTGPFGSNRRREMTCCSPQMIEILGSTETGGIGYRCIAKGESARFTPFKGIHFQSAADENKTEEKNEATRQPIIDKPKEIGNHSDDKWVSHLTSPFIPNHITLKLDDKLLVHADGSFSHYGRSDKIFKWNGKRFSLTNIEKNLHSFFSEAWIKCFVLDEGSTAKGCVLEAFVAIPGDACPPQSKNHLDSLLELRMAYVSRFADSPFPTKINRITDAEGFLQRLNKSDKLSLQTLKQQSKPW